MNEIVHEVWERNAGNEGNPNASAFSLSLCMTFLFFRAGVSQACLLNHRASIKKKPMHSPHA